jgi:hypothetical protein
MAKGRFDGEYRGMCGSITRVMGMYRIRPAVWIVALELMAAAPTSLRAQQPADGG